MGELFLITPVSNHDNSSIKIGNAILIENSLSKQEENISDKLKKCMAKNMKDLL